MSLFRGSPCRIFIVCIFTAAFVHLQIVSWVQEVACTLLKSICLPCNWDMWHSGSYNSTVTIFLGIVTWQFHLIRPFVFTDHNGTTLPGLQKARRMSWWHLMCLKKVLTFRSATLLWSLTYQRTTVHTFSRKEEHAIGAASTTLWCLVLEEANSKKRTVATRTQRVPYGM